MLFPAVIIAQRGFIEAFPQHKFVYKFNISSNKLLGLSSWSEG
jgi:hypothetical protein